MRLCPSIPLLQLQLLLLQHQRGHIFSTNITVLHAFRVSPTPWSDNRWWTSERTTACRWQPERSDQSRTRLASPSALPAVRVPPACFYPRGGDEAINMKYIFHFISFPCAVGLFATPLLFLAKKCASVKGKDSTHSLRRNNEGRNWRTERQSRLETDGQ